MGRVVAGLGLIAGLVILAVQNLSPMLTLVVFSTPTLTLPFSAWLLGSVAVGVLLTLILFKLLDWAQPTRRPYRPLGQRVRPTESSTSGRSGSGRSGSGQTGPEQAGPEQADIQAPRPNRPDSPPNKRSAQAVADDDDVDWGTYRPPSQWEEWGQRPDPSEPEPVAAQQGFSFRQRSPFSRPPFSQGPQGPDTAPDTALDDIAAGWEGYESEGYDSARYESDGYESAPYDSAYRQQGAYTTTDRSE
ncbi:MAG: hypothetical protein AAFZ80_02800 [Cyanobacteria bacterium P01_A01_bin.105]